MPIIQPNKRSAGGLTLFGLQSNDYDVPSSLLEISDTSYAGYYASTESSLPFQIIDGRLQMIYKFASMTRISTSYRRIGLTAAAFDEWLDTYISQSSFDVPDNFNGSIVYHPALYIISSSTSISCASSAQVNVPKVTFNFTNGVYTGYVHNLGDTKLIVNIASTPTIEGRTFRLYFFMNSVTQS